MLINENETIKSYQRATWVFKAILKATDQEKHIKEFDAVKLYKLFEHFNINARTQDDEHYRATSLKNIRHALNRHFNGVPYNQKLDIIKDTEFSVVFIRWVIQW